MLAAKHAIVTFRRAILAGRPIPDAIEDVAFNWALAAERNSVQPVINASGVVLHTGLGRARLADAAVLAIGEAAAHHATVEFDLVSGARGDRQDHVRDLICEFTGAPDALVVNNCASTVLLSLAALGFGKSVILSRGQMVEIGGAPRMPDVVRQSGAQLVEVGCTNKTHLRDYEEAIDASTAVILRCHPSNFRVTGFTEEPTLPELAALARSKGVKLIDDVGSGCLVDTTRFGLPHEPRFGDAVRQGADLELSSGDKMLGGPQAGLIIGSPEAIKLLREHPIARAVRIDKLTLAGLAATLKLYREGRELEIPTLRALSEPLESVRLKAERLATAYVGSVDPRGADRDWRRVVAGLWSADRALWFGCRLRGRTRLSASSRRSADRSPHRARTRLAGSAHDDRFRSRNDGPAARGTLAMTNTEIRASLGNLEAHAPGEAAHGERVSVYAVATADRLGGLDLSIVRATSALHDLGKLQLPSELFAVGHEWSAADVRAVRKHVELPSEVDDPDVDRVAIAQHHERLDGLGYPAGLSGPAICTLARIIAVCEAFDAMVHDVRYRAAKVGSGGDREIRRGAGTQFCPTVIEAFVAVQPLIQPLQS